MKLKRVLLGALKPHPENPRKIPRKGSAKWESLRNSLRSDYFDPLIVNSGAREPALKNVIVSGHFRHAVLVDEGYSHADAIIKDYTESEHKRVMLRANVIEGDWDDELLGSVLDSLGDEDRFLSGINFAKMVPKESEEDSATRTEENSIFQFREDAFFTASNDYGIPDLRPDMLSEQTPKDVWVNQEPGETLWMTLQGTNALPDGMRSIHAFYVDDYRFETIWTNAVHYLEQLIKRKPVAMLEPDFSLWWESPMAVQIWNVYRSRWCARYWQEAGIPVIPSLKWSHRKSYDVSICGLPKSIPVAAVQCRTLNGRKAESKFRAGLEWQLDHVSISTLLVYGGSIKAKLFEGLNTRCVLLPSWTERRTQIRLARDEAYQTT